MVKGVVWAFWFILSVASVTIYMEGLTWIKNTIRANDTKKIFLFATLLVLSGIVFIFLSYEESNSIYSGVIILIILAILEILGVNNKFRARLHKVTNDEKYKGY
jgi:phosphatidylglycerophosphate synthase